MRILAVSDTHNHHPCIYDDTDLLIHCGDATNTGSKYEFEIFSEWWNSIEAKYKIFIPGNHEVLYYNRIREKGRESVKEWLPSNVIVLINESIEIEGLKIYGSPVTQPVFKDRLYWAWEEFDDQRQKTFDLIPDELDILVTHTPPFEILDYVIGAGHVGCRFLKSILSNKKCKYHLFGHIHEHGGQSLAIGSIQYYNVACSKIAFELL